MEQNLFKRARDAVDMGDVERLRALVAEDPELATGRGDAATPETSLLLHLANWSGGKPNGAEAARILLEAGADANLRFRGDGETVLHWAASNDKDAAIVETLLDHGADIDAGGGVIRQGTPLVNALYFGFTEIAALLVRRGASIHNLIAAAGRGRFDLLNEWYAGEGRFLSAAARCDPSDGAAEGAMDVEKNQNWTYNAVICALCCGNYDVVDWFIERGFDIDFTPTEADWSCLHHAAYRGSLPMAMYLRGKGAELDVRTREHDANPMGYAYTHGHPAVLYYLIDQGTPMSLGDAACCGRLDKIVAGYESCEEPVALLFQAIGTKTAIGKPVHEDIRRHRREVIRFLLQRDPHLKDVAFEGTTAMKRAQALEDDAALALMASIRMGR